MRTEIAAIAGPREWGDSRASWLARVPEQIRKVLGTEKTTVSHRMVKALWYGEYANDPDHHAVRDVKRAAELISAQREARALAEKFRALAGGLDAANSTTYRAEIDRLQHVASLLCGENRRP